MILNIDFDLKITDLIIYKYLAVGIGVFILFRLIRIVIPYILSNKSKRKFLFKYMPFIEIIVWILFFISAVTNFQTNFYWFSYLIYFVLAMAVLFWTWFSLRDYIAGIVFRSTSNFYLGETLQIGEITGVIQKYGHRFIEIETGSGKTVQIPYNKILNNVIVKGEQGETIINHAFSVKIDKAIPIPEIIQEIRMTILQLPWASLKREPQVRVVKEEDVFYTLEVLVFAIDKSYFFLIENTVKNSIKNKMSRMLKSGFIK